MTFHWEYVHVMHNQSHVLSHALTKMSKTKRAELVARTYVLHIAPERAPEVSRTVELLATQTLAELHDCIQREFELDRDHLYAFFMSGRAWDRSSSYDGPGRNAERVTLHAVGCKPGKEFLYIFDFGAELRHTIRVESQGTRAPGQTYPRTLSAVGPAPPQYEEEEEPEVDAELVPLADEAAAACAQLERVTDSPSEEGCELCDNKLHHHLDTKESAGFLALEERLRRALQDRPQQFAAFEAYCEYALSDWLTDVLFDLAEAGRGDEALERHAAWLALLGEGGEEQIGSQLQLLLRAGYPERAKAESEQRLRSDPDDLSTLSVAADIYRECGELERAEALSRRYYDLAQQAAEPEELWAAGQQLADILRARGKTEEAAALELEVDEDVDLAWAEQEEEAEESESASRKPGFALASEPARPGQLQSVPLSRAPKIGRNQPCPCGSGKKHKKCCGA